MPEQLEGLPEMKPEDQQYFGKLLKDVDEQELTVEEAKERKIMKLLLKVKNGTPPQRKSALRQLTGALGSEPFGGVWGGLGRALKWQPGIALCAWHNRIEAPVVRGIELALMKARAGLAALLFCVAEPCVGSAVRRGVAAAALSFPAQPPHHNLLKPP